MTLVLSITGTYIRLAGEVLEDVQMIFKRRVLGSRLRWVCEDEGIDIKALAGWCSVVDVAVLGSNVRAVL